MSLQLKFQPNRTTKSTRTGPLYWGSWGFGVDFWEIGGIYRKTGCGFEISIKSCPSEPSFVEIGDGRKFESTGGTKTNVEKKFFEFG